MPSAVRRSGSIPVHRLHRQVRRLSRWKEITFQIFDVPSKGDQPFEERLEWLHSTFRLKIGGPKIEHVRVVDHIQAESREHVLDLLQEIEGVGGEGLMLRKPGSNYEGRRSSTLQKVKVGSW